LQPLIDGFDKDIEQITARIASRRKVAADFSIEEPLVFGGRGPDETERNYLIRRLP
jgi:hypothetical protein